MRSTLISSVSYPDHFTTLRKMVGFLVSNDGGFGDASNVIGHWVLLETIRRNTLRYYALQKSMICGKKLDYTPIILIYFWSLIQLTRR
jgi:hypothetical protein